MLRAYRDRDSQPQDLGAIFFVSVTGISSPSIDARLVNRMSLPVNIKRVPIFGLGCVAGAAGISRAADYVLAYPKQVAAVISVELCSLTLQREDISIANIISSGLFGDGAAAVLVSGAERTADGPEILATRSVFYPNSEHVMGWDISEKGFRIVLSREVPEVVQDHLASDVDAFLEEQGLSRADIGRMGAAHRRTARPGSHCCGARAARRRARGLLGLPAQNRQSLVGFRAAGAGRSYDPSAARAWNIQRTGCDGPRLLLRARAVEVVVDPEVFIVGGGPAGLAAGIAARLKRFRRRGCRCRRTAHRQSLRRRSHARFAGGAAAVGRRD